MLDCRFLIALGLGNSAQQVIGRGVVYVRLKQFPCVGFSLLEVTVVERLGGLGDDLAELLGLFLGKNGNALGGGGELGLQCACQHCAELCSEGISRHAAECFLSQFNERIGAEANLAERTRHDPARAGNSGDQTCQRTRRVDYACFLFRARMGATSIP